jgi:hypothetical protein
MLALVRARSLLALALTLAACSGSDDDGPKPVPPTELDASTGGDAGSAPIDADDPFEPDVALVDSGVVAEAGKDAGTSKDASADTKPADAGGATACQADLVAKGVKFKTTAARGVTDALTVQGPINGVLFASGTATTPMGGPMACAFVQTLWKFADLLKTRGFTRVGTLGSYCYRCCCAWSSTNYCRGLSDPEPDCSANGYSNHSWGRAIDVRYLYKADGTAYDINDAKHWVIWSTASETCTKGLAAQTGISKELYTLACQASQLKIFGITLTPNYNAVHRNHLHMDIGQSGAPTSWTTKSYDPFASPSGVDDATGAAGDDTCGGE